MASPLKGFNSEASIRTDADESMTKEDDGKKPSNLIIAEDTIDNTSWLDSVPLADYSCGRFFSILLYVLVNILRAVA